jgi:hypothetical protein
MSVSICIKSLFNNMCGVMVSVLATSAVEIGICCFSAKHACSI